MLKQIFFFFLLFTSLLQATPTLQISSNTTQVEDFELEYFIDETQALTLQEVSKQKFQKASNKKSYGMFKDALWVRFKLHNQTDITQHLFIHNKHGYVANNIDFYELSNNKLSNSETISLKNNEEASKKMYGIDAIFRLSLAPYETKTLYIKNTMTIMQFPYFAVYDAIHSKKELTHTNTLPLIFFGILIALALYHATLFISTRHKEYIYYTLYLMSAVIWESYISGIQAINLGAYNTPSHDYILLIVVCIPLFTALFTKVILDTKNKYPKENIYLNSILLFSFLVFALSIFSLVLALSVTSILFVYMFFIMFIVTYRIYRSGNEMALFLLVANTVFSILLLITNLYYLGVLEYTPFVFNAAIIGMIIESLILSFLLSYKIKLLQESEIEKTKALVTEVKKSREKDKIMFQQSKMASMGEMIENIAHQWRQPLSQINSSVLLIDDYMYQNNLVNSDVEKELSDIEKLTTYMSQTIDSFRNFFDKNKKSSSFSLNALLNSSLLLFKEFTRSEKIIVQFHAVQDFTYYGLKDELQQVIVILLNNAKDVLLERNITNATIKMTLNHSDTHYIIEISDNAGGIKEELLHKIFEPYMTTKHKSQGTGLGLYISKLIIEGNMLGHLTAGNNPDGAYFTIELPIDKEK